MLRNTSLMKTINDSNKIDIEEGPLFRAHGYVDYVEDYQEKKNEIGSQQGWMICIS
jgi:hypothetical protein